MLRLRYTALHIQACDQRVTDLLAGNPRIVCIQIENAAGEPTARTAKYILLQIDVQVFCMYTIYHQGGIMAGYTQFATLPENDEDYLVYMYQPEEHEDFAKFYKRFSGK